MTNDDKVFSNVTPFIPRRPRISSNDGFPVDKSVRMISKVLHLFLEIVFGLW
jgi:hypothetical protein